MGEHRAGVKDAFSNSKALGTEDEVVTGGEFEGAGTEGIIDRTAGSRDGREGGLSGPALGGSFFKFGEDTLFLEGFEGVGRGRFRVFKVPEDCVSGFSSVDRDLGDDLVVSGERDGLLSEVGADLGGEEVAAEGSASGAFFED